MGKKPKPLVPKSDTSYQKNVIQWALTSHLGGEMRKCRTALILERKSVSRRFVACLMTELCHSPCSNLPDSAQLCYHAILFGVFKVDQIKEKDMLKTGMEFPVQPLFADNSYRSLGSVGVFFVVLISVSN